MNITCLVVGWLFLVFATSILVLQTVTGTVRVEHPLTMPALFAVSALFFIAAK